MKTTGRPSISAKRRAKKKNISRDLRNPDNTADRIVSTATRLFASKGYDGTSVKDICSKAKVNIAAIHYHFGSKGNLYRHIIEQFASDRLDFAKRVLQPPRNPDELRVRLEIFLRQTLEAIIKQPDVILLIQRGIEVFDVISIDVFRKTILKVFEMLVEFLVQAKKNGLLASDVDPFFAAGLIRSQFLHQTRIDKVVKKYFGYTLSDEKYRDHWIQQTLALFLYGITRHHDRADGRISNKLRSKYN
jgi:AcrR family transcriptional regulator